MTRQIRAELRLRSRTAAAPPCIDKDQEARALALLHALVDCAKAELATMPHDEAVKALQDIGCGRAVIACYMEPGGKTLIKFNPPAEAIAACFPD
jgi:hypothetical protein